jgi:phosphoribosylformimino-5-aminoimidazole carboxamide ribotide isomerase
VDLLPAIDIRRGRVVRLIQGESTRETVYSENPLEVAERFAQEGARWIHVVDLDRAFGSGDNLPVLSAIIERLSPAVQVQAGGGFRSIDSIRAGLRVGVARIVIGTAAASDPGFLPHVVATVGSKRLAVGIDVRDGRVATRGWTETMNQRPEELATNVLESGVDTIVYTEISRDGMLQGTDVAGAVLLQQLGIRVIVSGGIAGPDDVRFACTAGLAGAIVGRALYEGRLTVAEAVRAAQC